MWCLIIQAVLVALLGLAALRLHIPKPLQRIRGCLAGLLTLAAICLLAAALLIA